MTVRMPQATSHRYCMARSDKRGQVHTSPMAAVEADTLKLLHHKALRLEPTWPTHKLKDYGINLYLLNLFLHFKVKFQILSPRGPVEAPALRQPVHLLINKPMLRGRTMTCRQALEHLRTMVLMRFKTCPTFQVCRKHKQQKPSTIVSEMAEGCGGDTPDDQCASSAGPSRRTSSAKAAAEKAVAVGSFGRMGMYLCF